MPQTQEKPQHFFPLITHCCIATSSTVQALPMPASHRHIQHHLVLIPAVKRKTRAFLGHGVGTDHWVVHGWKMPWALEKPRGGNLGSKARHRPTANTTAWSMAAYSGSAPRDQRLGADPPAAPRGSSARERAFPVRAEVAAGLSRPDLREAPDVFQGDALG